MRGARAKLLLLSMMAAASAPAFAEAPEVVEGLGPKKKQVLLEYSGQFGRQGRTEEGRQHSGQSFYGISDAFAIGGETQLSYRSGPLVAEDRLYFDYDSVIGLFRFGDAEEDPLGTGLWLLAGLDADGELARIEARFIAEKKTPNWWAEGNVMLRRVNEEAQEGAYVAYAGRVRRAVGAGTWAGIEASGQAAELSGFRREPLDKGHYVGANLTREVRLRGDDAFSVGVSYLRRVDEGAGLRNILQVSGEIRF